MGDAGGYSFQSQPRPVQTTRKSKNLYRRDEYEEQRIPCNIMFDRRVVRGSTYAAAVLPSNAHKEAERIRETREKGQKKRLKASERKRRARSDPAAPVPPVDGRAHAEMQTDSFLEELSDKVPEVDEHTQTDAFMDRPAEPLFMPAKVGVNCGTQVDVDELFDFDLEVEPILEVLVGKTLERAMMECLEEEEMENIRARQAEFEQARNIELAEVQRLEAEAKRKREERSRRVKQEEDRLERETNVEEKVAARSFAKVYLDGAVNSVFDKLKRDGHFYDPLKKEVREVFMPWLMGRVGASKSKESSSTAVLDDLIKSAMALAAGKRR